jgi:hypothetical protein
LLLFVGGLLSICRRKNILHPPKIPQNGALIMQLDEAQRQKVAAWVADGLKLSEIQARLASELSIRMTYMEARFLVDDLKLKLKDPEPPKAAPTIGAPAAPPAAMPPGGPPANPPMGASPAAAPSPAELPHPPGGVSMSVDQLARPGAIVSGKVIFSDGQQGEWYLDQTGRLGVVPRQQGYKPTAIDVQQFQLALQDELAKMGF